ncbi:hypothetical protein LARI1_G009302 [Lachnellula arida]|uniref:Uncharacterized protein n=1 Tax=Lachnellula arida TaxID=1316785 RepID=A0A8T9B6I1_9HELO|nr:hypothetical protein LARI1_G009302 [Lachnellula arida]
MEYNEVLSCGPKRRGTHYTNNLESSRSQVQPGDLCAGCIVWLPPKKAFDSEIRCSCRACEGAEELREGGYNHPVVVLRLRQRQNSSVPGDLICDIACMTTFNDTELDAYLAERTRRHHLRSSIPIYRPDLAPAPDGVPHLYLEKNTMHKQSYVRLKHIYQIDASKLYTFTGKRSRAYELRLWEPSYVTLMHQFGLEVENWHDTDTIAQTATYRLDVLAHSHWYRPQHELQRHSGRVSALENHETANEVELDYYHQPHASNHYSRSQVANLDAYDHSVDQNPVDAWPHNTPSNHGLRPLGEETRSPYIGWLETLVYYAVLICILLIFWPFLVLVAIFGLTLVYFLILWKFWRFFLLLAFLRLLCSGQ